MINTYDSLERREKINNKLNKKLKILKKYNSFIFY
jgi:hypothetical protein